MKLKDIFGFDFKRIGFWVVIALLVSSDIYPNQESLKVHPTKKEWQEFQKLPSVVKKKLWQQSQKIGHKLKDWSWTWRSAWIYSCGKKPFSSCSDILSQGLSDPAAVVRGQAVKAVGRIYQGSKSQQVVVSLVKAFSLKSNYRSKKPLFIQERILHALHLVGGAAAHKAARRLSMATARTKAYWDKLQKPAG